MKTPMLIGEMVHDLAELVLPVMLPQSIGDITNLVVPLAIVAEMWMLCSLRIRGGGKNNLGESDLGRNDG